MILHWEDVLLSASNDTTIREWSLATGAPVATYTGAASGINCVCLLQEAAGAMARILVGGCADGSLVCWPHGAADKADMVAHAVHGASVNHLRATTYKSSGDKAGIVVAIVSADAAGQVGLVLCHRCLVCFIPLT